MNIKIHVLQVGSRVHVLVPWNGLHPIPSVFQELVEERSVQSAPAVFIPINRG